MTQKKRIAPFSLRLTPEERAQLEKDAGGMPLGAYIHSCLGIRRTRGKHPVKDHETLGMLLGELGRLKVRNHLDEIAQAVKTGSLEVSPDTEKAIQNGCRDIRQLRDFLVSALGLKAENDYDP